MPQRAPIGLYDSGLGGLSVAREVLRQLPEESIVYLGDTARVPYGGRSASELIAFNREILQILQEAGVKAIVVACNTSSAIALPEVAGEVSVPILGLIEAGSWAASSGRRIGVIATEATIRSQAYQTVISAYAPEATVVPLACPRFVPLVESGQWAGPEAEQVVAESLAPLLEAQLDTLVLGCTHYPFLAPVIKGVLGDSVRMVDPACEIVRELGVVLANHDLIAVPGTVPHHQVFSSGDPALFTQLGSRLIGDALPAAQHVRVSIPQPLVL